MDNLSAMVDFGDSRDDAESLLEDLKEFSEKSVVSSLLKDCFCFCFVLFCFFFLQHNFFINFLKLCFNEISSHFNFTDCIIKLMIYVYCTLL